MKTEETIQYKRDVIYKSKNSIVSSFFQPFCESNFILDYRVKKKRLKGDELGKFTRLLISIMAFTLPELINMIPRSSRIYA